VILNDLITKKGYCLINAVIVGAGETGIRALQKISEHPEFGYNVIGFLDDDPNKINTTVCNIPVIGSLKELKRIVNDLDINKIIFAIPSLPKDQILKMIVDINKNNIMYMIVSNIFPVMSENMFFEDIGGTPYFILKANGESKIYDSFKRLFDILASIILLIIFSPFIPLIMLAIKIDSDGPIIFKQNRVGMNGKIFTMYKFRTMYHDVKKYERAPYSSDDPRITKVGKILRKFSLDEIPQFINVIKGDMSLIGPRPEMPFIVEKYNEWQRKRLSVRPGLTGLWQVLGRKELPLEENLEYDFYYIANRSISLDIAILIKTFFMVIRQKGAF
jgi:exopolysaccharide biosynthesis polyprenyl glycosylphosphotransferase